MHLKYMYKGDKLLSSLVAEESLEVFHDEQLNTYRKKFTNCKLPMKFRKILSFSFGNILTNQP